MKARLDPKMLAANVARSCGMSIMAPGDTSASTILLFATKVAVIPYAGDRRQNIRKVS
jgi:hypothetical protein